ncbi:MAG: nucleotide exchange factor GrpE [Phycisphaerales bacterium]
MSEKEELNGNANEPSEFDLDEAEGAMEFPDLEQDGDGAPADADPLADMQAERDALDDKLKRTIADYQNFARRAEQNIIVARRQQLIDVAKQLVTVLDHFDHAMAVDPEKINAADLIKGIGIVRDELMRTLSSFGVQRLDVQAGEAFDPNRHEALMRQPGGEIESNHVTAQLQPGYLLNDVTIRPAKVSIAE